MNSFDAYSSVKVYILLSKLHNNKQSEVRIKRHDRKESTF